MYIDPSYGGLIPGLLVGAFTLISGLVLVFSGRIKKYFSQLRRKTQATDEDEADAPK